MNNKNKEKQPPRLKTTVSILYSDYQRLLAMKDFDGQSAADILTKILYRLDSIQEESRETREFLNLAIEDKKQYRLENEELRQRLRELDQRLKKIESMLSSSRSSQTYVCI